MSQINQSLQHKPHGLLLRQSNPIFTALFILSTKWGDTAMSLVTHEFFNAAHSMVLNSSKEMG